MKDLLTPVIEVLSVVTIIATQKGTMKSLVHEVLWVHNGRCNVHGVSVSEIYSLRARVMTTTL